MDDLFGKWWYGWKEVVEWERWEERVWENDIFLSFSLLNLYSLVDFSLSLKFARTSIELPLFFKCISKLIGVERSWNGMVGWWRMVGGKVGKDHEVMGGMGVKRELVYVYSVWKKVRGANLLASPAEFGPAVMYMVWSVQKAVETEYTEFLQARALAGESSQG